MYGGRICDQLRRLGSSVDWSREVFTLDDNLSVSLMRERFFYRNCKCAPHNMQETA